MVIVLGSMTEKKKGIGLGCHGSEAMSECPDTGMRLTSDRDMAHGHSKELPCSVSLNTLGSSSEGPKWPKGLWDTSGSLLFKNEWMVSLWFKSTVARAWSHQGTCNTQLKYVCGDHAQFSIINGRW